MLNTYPTDFTYDKLIIEAKVVHAVVVGKGCRVYNASDGRSRDGRPCALYGEYVPRHQRRKLMGRSRVIEAIGDMKTDGLVRCGKLVGETEHRGI